MEKNITETELDPSPRGGVAEALRRGIERRRSEPLAVLSDVLLFTLNFLFARYHFLWGSYPLAVSFIAAAPVGVWVALFGALVGALSLGRDGIVHALIALIVVFLRLVISGGIRASEKAGFSEPLLLRVSASVIGGFIGTVYELLLSGLSRSTLLYGLAACLFGAAFTALFSGLFRVGLTFGDVFFGSSPVFEVKRVGKARYELLLFQLSALALVFFISLSLKEYVLLGIDLAFVFAALATLFAAKRFGAVRAVAVGFVSSFGLSPLYSVGFALLGLGSGLLFPLGYAYALLGGGVLLSAWSAYGGSLSGFLSTFPEYATAAALFFPFLKFLSRERSEEVREDGLRVSRDMVGAMALSHRSERGDVDRLSVALAGLGTALERLGRVGEAPTREEIEERLALCAKDSCRLCSRFAECTSVTPAPCIESVAELAERFQRHGKLSADDASLLPDYCASGEYLMARLSVELAHLAEARYRGRKLSELSEIYELTAKMINEARQAEEREQRADSALSEKLAPLLREVGLTDGVIRVFGERRKRFIAAGEDATGDVISGEALREGIEKISGLKLGAAEFFRKGRFALLDCRAAPAYTVEFAERSAVAPDSERSGDTVTSAIGDDGCFFAILSDGMGSGEEAGETSRFVGDLLSGMLTASVSETTALYAINQLLRSRSGECSATADIFKFNMLSGEASFIKSGAAASYVKRESSLFRIRSDTVPLGLMRSIDSERIRVEVKSGDTVVMLSDGVSQSQEDAVWLSELLARPFTGSAEEYAATILAAARKSSRTRDDMSVAVMRIVKI